MYVQTFFKMILQMMIFFSELFKDNVSKRYVLIFQKRRYVQKIFSMIFKCFKIYVQRKHFSMISYNVYSKSMHTDFFEIYIFMYIEKDFQ